MNMKPDLAVNDREELIYLLTEAAEFEHTVMCTYLYALWSMKHAGEVGITPGEGEAIERWRASIRQVAMEEMLHMGLVNNLLASIGAAPHLARPEFPVAGGYFPAEVDFHLAPFTPQSIDHFVFLERPEGIALSDGAGFGHDSHYQRVVCSDLLSPTPRDYVSQGHLYHGIAQAIKRLAGELGEDGLFVGHGEAQLASDEFPLPGLFKVRDVKSAMAALEEIVLQGEGAPAHRDDSHYARFAAIRDEYEALREARPEFEPAYPAAVNPVLTEIASATGTARITSPLARRLVDLGNSLYGLMLHTTAQVCTPAPLPAELRADLADVSAEMMRLLTVFGEASARTPLGENHPGMNAGLSFALPRSFGQLVQANAAQILGERAAELAAASYHLEEQAALTGAGETLDRLAERLAELHDKHETHFRPDNVPQAVQPSSKPEIAAPTLRIIGGEDNEASTDCITLRFDTERCIHSRNCVLNAPRVFLANVKGPWLHPEADTIEHLKHVAQSCPSGAITYERLDGGEDEPVPEVNFIRIRENGPYAIHASLDIEGQGDMYRATLCRCGQSRNKPFCDNSHINADFRATGEPETLPSEPLDERGGALRIEPCRNGPLMARGPLEICSGTGRTVNRVGKARLCRCGGSRTKPFCDNSHVRIGFKSD